jgi:hypothetical protein
LFLKLTLGIIKEGHDGYGRWLHLLEIVASKMEK